MPKGGIMSKPMDEMPKGWSEVYDRDMNIVLSNIMDRTKVQMRVIEDSRVPLGKTGHIIIQRRHPDRYSTLFMFSNLEEAFAWACGFDSATSLIRLKPAELTFI
jgi:hypothetical protein